jgi:hypothetical protein
VLPSPNWVFRIGFCTRRIGRRAHRRPRARPPLHRSGRRRGLCHDGHFPYGKAVNPQSTIAVCGLSGLYRQTAGEMPISSDVRIFGWTRVWSAEWTDPRTACRSPTICGRDRRPCCMSRPGSGDDDGVTPQQAAITCRVGAVVGPLPRSRTFVTGHRADVGVIVAVQPGRDEVRGAPPVRVQPAPDHHHADRRGPGAAHGQSR